MGREIRPTATPFSHEPNQLFRSLTPSSDHCVPPLIIHAFKQSACCSRGTLTHRTIARCSRNYAFIDRTGKLSSVFNHYHKQKRVIRVNKGRFRSSSSKFYQFQNFLASNHGVHFSSPNNHLSPWQMTPAVFLGEMSANTFCCMCVCVTSIFCHHGALVHIVFMSYSV